MSYFHWKKLTYISDLSPLIRWWLYGTITPVSRWIRFLIAVLLGGVLGLLYGWVVNPVKYVDTTPSSLRADYQADYVLMVAESYNQNRDLPLAARRLALLGESSPTEHVRQALIFGAQNGYADSDLELLSQLASDLQTWNPITGTGGS